MSADLLPCPFCGGDANAKPHSQHQPGCYFDVLASFKAASGIGDLSMNPELLASWNRRAQPAATPAPVRPMELMGIAEALAEGDGFWRSCSGCHELNEGHATGPYSALMKCHLGNGCSECGGIGAIWDTTDYQAMGDDMARSMQTPAAAQQADYSQVAAIVEGDEASRVIRWNRGVSAFSYPVGTELYAVKPNYPGATVADRLDAMADDCVPGSQRHSDLLAAATVWRKHLTGPAAQQDAADAARYRWLTDDHDDANVREHRNSILRRMPVMSHSAASADIDAARAAAPTLPAAPDQQAVRDAVDVMAALDTGEWSLTRCLPDASMTDAANTEHAWMVQRQRAPFCGPDGVRIWTGSTAIVALNAAIRTLKSTNGGAA